MPADLNRTQPEANPSRLESRLRWKAQRQGLTLQKSRTRNPQATEHGTFMVVDPYTNTVVALGLSSGYGMTLDEVAAYLTTDDAEAER